MAESLDALLTELERVGKANDGATAARPGGLLVVDDAISHPEQMAPFVALVDADAGFTTNLVPVGNGEFLDLKA